MPSEFSRRNLSTETIRKMDRDELEQELRAAKAEWSEDDIDQQLRDALVEAISNPLMPKRFSGPSGKPGKHRHPARPLRAPKAFFELVDRAIEHNADSKSPGGYEGFSDWARHILTIAAADELGLEPLEALRVLDGA